MNEPTPEDARRIAGGALGEQAVGARRFTTGLHHFVYEVELSGQRTVVLRLTRPSERQVMRNAVTLSRQLRPVGIPLPQLMAADTEAPFPWMMLERLAGVDLGEVISTLPNAHSAEIAKGIVAAQRIAGTLRSAGRYGYAATADAAPFERWSDVVAHHVHRSRERIAAAGLFDLALVDRLESVLGRLRDRLDAIEATPFLHDTTTKNVIVASDGTLSGIVDVDDLCFGDPRYVSALTRVALTAHGQPTAYVDELMRAADWADDGTHQLYIAAFLLDFMSEHGQVFNGNQRPSSGEARARLQSHYQEALDAI